MDFDYRLAAWAPRVLSIARIAIALTLLQHPAAKFFGIPYVPFFDNLPISSIYMVAGAIELIAGIAFLVGFYTRAAAFVLSGHLAFVYFIGHAPKGFYPLLNGGESAVVFCFVFLYFAFAGGGPWSLDGVRSPEGADTMPQGTDRAHAA
jgi:putative oxidoreductase